MNCSHVRAFLLVSVAINVDNTLKKTYILAIPQFWDLVFFPSIITLGGDPP